MLYDYKLYYGRSGSRLKLGNETHYVLNAKGSTNQNLSLHIIPLLMSKTSMAKLEQLTSLQQKLKEKLLRLKGKKSYIAAEEVSSLGLGLCTAL